MNVLQKIRDFPNAVLKKYIHIMATFPGVVMIISFLVSLAFTAVGFVVGGVPEMGDPSAGFEARGENLILDILTWKKFFRALAFQKFEHMQIDSADTSCINTRKNNSAYDPTNMAVTMMNSNQFVSVYLKAKSSDTSIWSVDTQQELCLFTKSLNTIVDSSGFKNGADFPIVSVHSVYNNMTLFQDCNILTDNTVNDMQQQISGCNNVSFSAAFKDCSDETVPQHCRTAESYLTYKLLPNDRSQVVYWKMSIPVKHYRYYGRSVGFIRYLTFYKKIIEAGRLMKYTSVAGIDAGFRDDLYRNELFKDMLFIGMGIVVITLLLLLYLRSVLLTVATLISLIFSVGIAYFMYTIVIGVKFFPFVNLFALVILIAVGADDAFVLQQCWSEAEAAQSTRYTEHETMEKSDKLQAIAQTALPHAIKSMFVTSLTTSASLLVNTVSSVIVIKCFGLFAGFTVIFCYFLVITWLSSTLIFIKKHCNCCGKVSRFKSILPNRLNLFCSRFVNFCQRGVKNMFNVWLPKIIFCGRIPLIIVFTGLTIGLAIAAFVSPMLQLPHKEVDRLFVDMSNPESFYHFSIRDLYSTTTLEKISARFLWGFHRDALGDLDKFNGKKLGSEIRSYTPDDLVDTASSVASKKFIQQVGNACDYLFKQPEVAPNYLPGSNGSWVREYAEWSKTSFNCSGTATKQCISEFWASRRGYGAGGGGIIFVKNSGTGDPIVGIEISVRLTFFPSLEYNQQEAVVTAIKRLQSEIVDQFNLPIPAIFTDPPESIMQYNLLKGLNSGLKESVLISGVIAFICVLATTRNVKGTVVSLIVITCTVIAVMGVLALLGWQLNTVECALIILSVGLAFDFTLHYAVTFNSFDSAEFHELDNDNPKKGRDDQSKEYRDFRGTFLVDNKNNTDTIQNGGGKCGKTAAVKSFRHGQIIAVMSYIGVPVSMAAITTIAVGSCLMLAATLAFYQIGTFLVLVTAISWIYATFFYIPLITVVCDIFEGAKRMWKKKKTKNTIHSQTATEIGPKTIY